MKVTKKKGVVLLITLLFITAISALILKNLDSTSKFIDQSSLNSDLTQLKITNQNIQDEIIKFFHQNKDDDETLEKIIEVTSLGVPLKLAHIDIFLQVDYMFDIDEDVVVCNINDLKTQELLYKYCDDAIIENINFPYDFVYILNQYLKKYKKIDTKEKLIYFLDDYKNRTKDMKIQQVYDSFEYTTKNTNKNKTQEEFSKYIVSYNLTINKLKASGSFVFDIHTKDILSQELYLN